MAILTQTQARLLDELPRRLTQGHRDFLLSLVSGDPEWELMPFRHLSELPAVRWKLMNLHKLKKNNSTKFKAQRLELTEHFEKLA
jgi:hypothetical protein